MKCTECGSHFEPDCPEEEICGPCQVEDLPEAHMMRYVFTNCNVCGIILRTEDEHRMGMCERCCLEGP